MQLTPKEQIELCERYAAMRAAAFAEGVASVEESTQTTLATVEDVLVVLDHLARNGNTSQFQLQLDLAMSERSFRHAKDWCKNQKLITTKGITAITDAGRAWLEEPPQSLD